MRGSPLYSSACAFRFVFVPPGMTSHSVALDGRLSCVRCHTLDVSQVFLILDGIQTLPSELLVCHRLNRPGPDLRRVA